MHGTVYDADGKPAPGAQVEVWHCDTRGFYSHFDPTGKQETFNMRRTIIADEHGRYRFRSIVRSEVRRVGKEWARTCRSRWAQERKHTKQTTHKNNRAGK